MQIKQGVELPKIQGRGRPKGAGINLRLLRALRPGDTVWEVSKRKMHSIIQSANLAGIRLMVRRIPGSNKYAFKVLYEQSTSNEDRG